MSCTLSLSLSLSQCLLMLEIKGVCQGRKNGDKLRTSTHAHREFSSRIKMKKSSNFDKRITLIEREFILKDKKANLTNKPRKTIFSTNNF